MFVYFLLHSWPQGQDLARIAAVGPIWDKYIDYDKCREAVYWLQNAVAHILGC